MIIGGFQKFSLVDYPGKISAILFTKGCNFRCPYCHNPELVNNGNSTEIITETEVLEFLKTRIGKLDAVSITGGEPTLHRDLPAFIRKIKKLGFLVKLDTNGTNPKMIENLIKEDLIDYFAMDLKSPISKYHLVTMTDNFSINDIQISAEMIKKSSKNFEFRTTFIEQIISENDLYQIPRDFGPLEHYHVQKFNPNHTLDSAFQKLPGTSESILTNIERTLNIKCDKFSIR